MGKVLAVNLDSSLRNKTCLNEFMSKAKVNSWNLNTKKLRIKVMAVTHRVVRWSNQKSLNQVTETNYNLILANIVNS